MSPLFLLLLISVSLHACNARYLGLIHKETRKQVFTKVLVQDIDDVNLHRSSVDPSEMMPPVSDANKSLIGASETTINKNDHVHVEALLKQEEDTTRATSGAGNKVIVSSQADLQQGSKIIAGLKVQERSMIGSTSNDTEAAVESEESDNIAEYVGVMDYAQPHRKPPIHNEKP